MGTAAVTESFAPEVTANDVTFRLPDPDEALKIVELLQDVQRPRLGPHFAFDAETKVWTLTFPRPDADRIEYSMHLVHHDGSEEWIPDPANERRAEGPFGERSVIEWPEYAPPAWVGREVPQGSLTEAELPSRTLRVKLRTLFWAAPGVSEDQPLPLLVAHDGPEYAQLSALTKLLEIGVADGRIPPLRAALIAPVDRDQIYSASAAYSRALAYEILPEVYRRAPTPHGRSMRVGMGASLGALAMLHLHRTSPSAFGALFLQSGSFFRLRFDKQESGFVRFRRISRFMGSVLTAEAWPHPIPVTLTCGTAEENLANNRATRDALARQGYDVHLHENRDAHNWIGWRDTFDPFLLDLLAKVWS